MWACGEILHPSKANKASLYRLKIGRCHRVVVLDGQTLFSYISASLCRHCLRQMYLTYNIMCVFFSLNTCLCLRCGFFCLLQFDWLICPIILILTAQFMRLDAIRSSSLTSRGVQQSCFLPWERWQNVWHFQCGVSKWNAMYQDPCVRQSLALLMTMKPKDLVLIVLHHRGYTKRNAHTPPSVPTKS